MSSRLRSVVLAGGLLFLAIHLAHLPQTLEDIDSINFALGVEDFDVPNHQPHPPGYPVFMVLAKASTAVVGFVRPGWDRDRRAAAGLAALGVVAGALGVFVLAEFWTAAGLTARAGVLAALVTVTAPLFWLTASRPLTDVPGLVVAVLVQTWLLRGLARLREEPAGHARMWIAASAAAGLAIGFRSQSLWLTSPFVAWGLLWLVRQQRWREVATTIAAAAAGVVTWFVPLLMASGPSAYFRVLTAQSTDDFAGPHMLAVSLTGRRFSTYLGHTFVYPWQDRTFAYVVLALALAGAVRLAIRQRHALAVAVWGFLPYLIFHLAFQETVTIRYALPMLVPVAGLAVAALMGLGARIATLGSTAVVVASLVFGEPRLSAYSGTGAPAFRAFQDMQRALPSTPEPPTLKMHHQVWWAVRRVADWYKPVWHSGPQPFPGDREWLSVVDAIRGGERRPVWFLAHLSRTDMAVFDPRNARLAGTYVMPSSLALLIGGARVDTFAWWVIDKPGWMLGRGWALTPELAGMTEQDQSKGQRGPAEGFLARQPGPVRVLIAGRYLGPNGGPPGRVFVTLDGRSVADWTVTSNPRSFLQWIDLPAGTAEGPGRYATLAVRIEGPQGPVPEVGLEQFDAGGAADSIAAFADGWFEHEENPTTGLTWRWMGKRSTIEVRGPSQNRTLVISGESPMKYFSTPPTITVRAGDRELGKFTFRADFSQPVNIPAAALDASQGLITIESDRTFKPADLQPGSPDQRDLSLRMYSAKLK